MSANEGEGRWHWASGVKPHVKLERWKYGAYSCCCTDGHHWGHNEGENDHLDDVQRFNALESRLAEAEAELKVCVAFWKHEMQRAEEAEARAKRAEAKAALADEIGTTIRESMRRGDLDDWLERYDALTAKQGEEHTDE